MSRIEEYVKRNFKDIPDSGRKEQLRQEILQNLNEKVYDLTQQGKTQEDAENKTIAEFGDFDDIKQVLGKGLTEEDPPKNYFLRLWFSVFGSALIIALLAFINSHYFNSIKSIWFVLPVFGVLWWPLSMTFAWLKHRK